MAPQRKFIDNVRDMFDLRDVYHDVVNFSESNRERAMRKLERIKNVFTAMRWGEQRPAHIRIVQSFHRSVCFSQARHLRAPSTPLTRGGGAW